MTVYWKHRKSANWQPQLTIWNTESYGNPGDFTALQNAINEAQEYIASHASSYTGAIVALYQDEVNIAQDLANEGKVNQNAIDRQLENLASARTALEATEGFDFDVTGITTGYDTERGFRHPGALHTDADFERIRKQLKAGNEKSRSSLQCIGQRRILTVYGCYKSRTDHHTRRGVGENYINAAQGASIAYQNALRWKIDGSEEHAIHAVDVPDEMGTRHQRHRRRLQLCTGCRTIRICLCQRRRTRARLRRMV